MSRTWLFAGDARWRRNLEDQISLAAGADLALSPVSQREGNWIDRIFRAVRDSERSIYDRLAQPAAADASIKDPKIGITDVWLDSDGTAFFRVLRRLDACATSFPVRWWF